MDEQQKLKEHVVNLLNALSNLSPSRNLISQLILLLPKDSVVIEHSYPEFNELEARKILSLIGVKFNEQVTRDAGSFADTLYKYIHELFDWLNEEIVRVEIAKITDTSLDSIPNPYAEWAKKVLAKFMEMPNGNKILNFLKMLIEHDLFITYRRGYSRGANPPDWTPFLDEAKKKLQINPAELEEILKLTVSSPQSNQSSVDTFKHEYGYPFEKEEGSDTREQLMHSEYHLDLVISAQSRHRWGYEDYGYLIRQEHKKTIKNLLEEVRI